MIYELRQFNKVLLKFDYKEVDLNRIINIIYVNLEHKHLLPIGLKLTNEGLMTWLKSRTIPQNREYVNVLLSKMGVNVNDTIGIINLCKGLSLNDSYWIVEEDFNGTFEEYNLYDNEFSNVLSLIAYTGYGSRRITGVKSSPEFTTNGMLPKAWRRINVDILLYKGGTSGFSNTGNEPFSEYFASQIAEKMGLNHIKYSLSNWKKMVCSTCKLFTNKDISFVPIYKFIDSNENVSNINYMANYFKELGEKFYNSFVDMIIFDSLIYNTDRHANNYGLLVDNHTNKVISFAPLFDHGMSLFNYAMIDDLKNIDQYAKTRTSVYGFDHTEIAKRFISKRQKDQLKKLIDFKFVNVPKHISFNIERKKLLEKFIQKRGIELLNL